MEVAGRDGKQMRDANKDLRQRIGEVERRWYGERESQNSGDGYGLGLNQKANKIRFWKYMSNL